MPSCVTPYDRILASNSGCSVVLSKPYPHLLRCAIHACHACRFAHFHSSKFVPHDRHKSARGRSAGLCPPASPDCPMRRPTLPNVWSGLALCCAGPRIDACDVCMCSTACKMNGCADSHWWTGFCVCWRSPAKKIFGILAYRILHTADVSYTYAHSAPTKEEVSAYLASMRILPQGGIQDTYTSSGRYTGYVFVYFRSEQRYTHPVCGYHQYPCVAR